MSTARSLLILKYLRTPRRVSDALSDPLALNLNVHCHELSQARPVHEALDYACLVMSTQATTELMLQESALLTYIPWIFFVHVCFFYFIVSRNVCM
jgi:hypothetical protein